MPRFVIRLGINAVAFYMAVALLDGQHIFPSSDNWLNFFWLALIFGVVNGVIRPILMVLSCPLIILTLGLGTLLINTVLFVLVGWIGDQFGVGFRVSGFWGAFLGALIVSVVSFVLSQVFRDGRRR